jgi:hypothetical protein
MGGTSTMDAHTCVLKGLTKELNNAGIPESNEIQILVMLDSLPSSYLGYVQAITSRDNRITFELLESKLLVEECRMQLDNPTTVGASTTDVLFV